MDSELVTRAQLLGNRRNLRSMLMASHVMGLALLGRVLEVKPLASVPIDRVAAMVRPLIQACLTEVSATNKSRA